MTAENVKQSKFQLAPIKTVVEGAGSGTFDANLLYATAVLVPAALTWGLDLSMIYFVPMFIILSLPIFALFQVISASTLAPIRFQKGLSNKPLEHYLKINNPEYAQYKEYSKIPMETFFEAYFDGDIDIKHDMLDLLENRYDWARFVFTMGQVKYFLSQWVPETLWHSRKQDKDQVREHYDRGNDFYNWFLGPMMVYTSGIVTSSTERETLEQMQQKKLETVSHKIGLKGGDRMLDIGCGWGTLGVHAAKMGAKVTGVTLGLNQTEWAMNTAKEAGVEDKMKVLCMDYRDIPKETYDKITCLEMAEHVGVLRFSTFLNQVREMLADDGLFFLQIAGLRRYWQYEDLTWGVILIY